MQGTIELTTDLVHRGKAFDVYGTGSIAATASYSFACKAGAENLHFHGFQVEASQGNVLIELIEAPTISNYGTETTPRNKNRASSNTSKTKVYGGITATGGTVISARKIVLAGGGAHTEGGTGNFNAEWVLRPNTEYQFKITNQDINTAVDFATSFFYYEEPI